MQIKFDCLIFEMLFVKELNAELNTHIKTIFAPNSLRDSACEYLIALSPHIFAFYLRLLGILLIFIVILISFILDLIMT